MVAYMQIYYLDRVYVPDGCILYTRCLSSFSRDTVVVVYAFFASDICFSRFSAATFMFMRETVCLLSLFCGKILQGCRGEKVLCALDYA